ncbi:MAG: hypothetical protein HY831_00595 [Candidatus Aenigmarchaeota archaeon]|nr:hypothetical protein [Candidatus Aenigmarchaeota archaeon]
MGFFARLFTFRGKVYSLRKKYDKFREKADKEDNTEKRMNSLKILDQVEPTLVILEEQNMSRFDRTRMVAVVDSGVEQAKAILEDRLLIKQTQQTTQGPR